MPARAAHYWDHDLQTARAGEQRLAAALRADPAVRRLVDHTAATDAVDFEVHTADGQYLVDLKEKRQPYGAAIRGVAPRWQPQDLFVVDETFVRRAVMAGRPVVLAVHDMPEGRWCYLTTWDLVLGPRIRYRRQIQRRVPMTKGKLLYDLSSASAVTPRLDVPTVLRLAQQVQDQVDQVDAISRDSLPVV